MNKLNREIVKSIKKLNAETTASYKLFFDKLKKKGIVVFDDFAWDRPTMSEFRCFGADANGYVQSICNEIMIKRVGASEIRYLIECPDGYSYVTKDELKKFETVTYPKLYAKWREEQKQKRAANGEDAAKIRAKIEKLQRQLKDLEA